MNNQSPESPAPVVPPQGLGQPHQPSGAAQPVNPWEIEMARLQKENTRLKTAFGALINRMEEVHAHTQYKESWALWKQAKGMQYDGPKYGEQFRAAKAALIPEI